MNKTNAIQNNRKLKNNNIKPHPPFTTEHQSQDNTNNYQFEIKQASFTPIIRGYHNQDILIQQQKDQNSIDLQIQPGRLTELPLKYNYYLSSIENAYKPPFKQDYFSNLFREHFVQTCQGIQYGTIAQPVDKMFLENNKIILGENKSNSKNYLLNFIQKQIKKAKKSIIFDLDETLIHCNESNQYPADVYLSITFPTGDTVKAGINIRPMAVETLKDLSEQFEIIVFTASHNCYANKVLDYLDPQGLYIHHRFFRDKCVQTLQGVYVKDLRIFSDRQAQDIVLVDNASYSYGFQIENGIPILPFYDRKDDQEFKFLKHYLKQLVDQSDVRVFNQNQLKLQLFTDPQGPQKVYELLFLN